MYGLEHLGVLFMQTIAWQYSGCLVTCQQSAIRCSEPANPCMDQRHMAKQSKADRPIGEAFASGTVIYPIVSLCPGDSGASG